MSSDEFFGPVIYAYTRRQAITDGVLIDVTKEAKEAGFSIPVAMTRAVYEDCVAWTDADNDRKGTLQDEAGRLWDCVWMAFVSARRNRGGDRATVTPAPCSPRRSGRSAPAGHLHRGLRPRRRQRAGRHPDVPRGRLMTADLHNMIGRLTEEVGAVFETMEWADDEIAQATRRHPAAADALWHSFALIRPPDGMGTEFVYRSHARELLERVAAGGDTRPGTAAEVVMACAAASAVVPFHASAAGLYMRMWATAFPGTPSHDGQAEELAHYEALRGSEIDDLEAMTRRKTTVPGRVVGSVTCQGLHHGEPVACRFAPTPALAGSFEQPSLLGLAAA